ncbi:siderophore-interacting protein [Streptomyces sp. NPDC091219]|uniref:siderophore-interacting protein n=1 Tax=Streptomyces sp. NPDC091219 TaxID=3155193 RepID=UPI003450AD7D
MTTALAAPFRIFSLHVVRTERLGPSLVRVTFTGDDPASFLSDGCDQSLSLLLPHPGHSVPASRWASRAGAGDRVVPLGPAVADNPAIRFRPPEDTDPVVARGDETALPAVSAILEGPPAGLRARVWDREDSPSALGALRATRLPSAERPYVWIAGESGQVKALRRHFAGERAIDRRRVTFAGYWRQGFGEEQVREAG